MVYFARYDSNAIKVNRKRKRAIAKQKVKTRSKVIEVGDMVEVVYNSFSGFRVGTLAYVIEIERNIFVPDNVSISIASPEDDIHSLSSMWHRLTDIKLIEKGTKQHG